jgi:hypothetical protein
MHTNAWVIGVLPSTPISKTTPFEFINDVETINSTLLRSNSAARHYLT